MSQAKSHNQAFKELIDQAMNHGPYSQLAHTSQEYKTMHYIWCAGVLRELLAYSACDMMEVRQHLRGLSEREPIPVGSNAGIRRRL